MFDCIRRQKAIEGIQKESVLLNALQGQLAFPSVCTKAFAIGSHRVGFLGKCYDCNLYELYKREPDGFSLGPPTRDYANQMVAALSVLERNRIIYRDVKP